MGLFGEFAQGVLERMRTSGPPDKKWLNKNCAQVNLSDSDISAIVRYFKKPQFHIENLVVSALIYIGSTALEEYISEKYGFEDYVFKLMETHFISFAGAGLALIFVFLFFAKMFSKENKDIADMLQLRTFTSAYEILVSHKERHIDEIFGRTFLIVKFGYYIYTEGKDLNVDGKAFRVGKKEYKTVCKGQPAIAITSSFRRVCIFNLRNL